MMESPEPILGPFEQPNSPSKRTKEGDCKGVRLPQRERFDSTGLYPLPLCKGTYGDDSDTTQGGLLSCHDTE